MIRYTSKVVPSFDFADAESHCLQDRFAICLAAARCLVEENGYQRVSDFPCVPSVGASEEESATLESIIGVALPPEYRAFLSICRYLKIDDGREIGGLDWNGLHVTESPWTSNHGRENADLLVFANFWRYADGDQLLIDLSDSTYPVIAYLHEHGPLFELYAPSFSLALWRLVHE